MTPRFVWRGHSCPRLGADPLPDFLRGQPRHSNHFISAARAGRYGNGRTRNLQKIREEFNAGLVGSPFDGRGSQGQFKRVSEFAGNGISLRAGLDLHGKHCPCGAVVDGNHFVESVVADSVAGRGTTPAWGGAGRLSRKFGWYESSPAVEPRLGTGCAHVRGTAVSPLGMTEDESIDAWGT